MGKMFFNILATFAEFEVDLLRLRTREGMAVARAKGKLRGKQPKLSPKQQRELVRMAGSGEYTIAVPATPPARLRLVTRSLPAPPVGVIAVIVDRHPRKTGGRCPRLRGEPREPGQAAARPAPGRSP